MKEIMEREGLTRAEMSRRMNVSRARITQRMNLLKLSPEVIEKIKGLGDNLERPVITERRLRGWGKKGGGKWRLYLKYLIRKNSISNYK